MSQPHPHHPGLEEVDYLQDPDGVLMVGEPDPETSLIRWIEVAYGYLNGTEYMEYIPHDDPASRHGAAEIADQLGVSRATVNRDLQDARRLFGVATDKELVLKAALAEVIQPAPA